MKVRVIIFLLLTAMSISCSEKIEQPEPVVPPQPSEPVHPSEPSEPVLPQWPSDQTGKSYVWDEDCIPHIRIYVTKSSWNELLEDYDKHSNATRYVKCNFVFDKDGIKDSIPNTALRVRDNIDGMRPEGTAGQKHSAEGTQWHPANYEVDFQRYVQGESHTLRYVNGLYLKSCLNDPSYSREKFCYDTFRMYGIWTISDNIYCRLSIHVEGDTAPAYIGIYNMIEPVDSRFLSERESKFGTNNGNLWKCINGAFLNSPNISAGMDNGNGESYDFMLISSHKEEAAAYQQLTDFIRTLNTITATEFPAWIRNVCDVDFLLKTYAVNVALGMCDDFWNTGSNFYLYFASTGDATYKVFFIPHDYEISLGNTIQGSVSDPAMQDPYKWGSTANTLMTRLMTYEEFRKIYKRYLQEICDPYTGLLQYEMSSNRILDLMYFINAYTDNDTGLNPYTKDRPASWSLNQSYRLTDMNNNFFAAKSEAIAAME